MTTGDLLAARVAMKPLSTLNRPVLRTVDVETKEATVSFKERTDVTAVPASGVVAETMVALVLATEALRKFGGDSLDEVAAQPPGVPRRRSGDRRHPTTPRPRRAHGRREDHGGGAVRATARAPVRRHRRPRRDPRRRPVAELFATDGEAAFRAFEHQAVADACASPARW